MKAGLVIYTSSIHHLTSFYSHVFGFEVIESDDTYALLSGGEFELVLLETEAAKSSVISFEPRETTPLKPVFFSDLPLTLISERVKDKGGSVYPPKHWDFRGHQVCDAYDCEGNIFQLRINRNA
ncbi:MAG: hypothetical protein CR962_01435 [Gammaproteobacteria bacterium]|nr:MAG: hypothetical protein CR962_01435 [Gammaproteobacteria bacterium]